MQKKISPSMMCASPITLANTLKTFESNKIEYLHIDIMDGEFVPNYTLGPDYCRCVRNACDIPLDIHLMVMRPEDKLAFFDIREGDIVSVHAEATCHLHRAVARIKERGAKAFVALNPATPLTLLDEIAGEIDGVLIMTVDPGFAGQKMIPSMLDKIRRLRERFTDMVIEVDGNVSYENARLMKNAGADIFVVGTASVFSKDNTLDDGIKKMRNVIKENE